MKTIYRVYDSWEKQVGPAFSSYQDAFTWCSTMQRYDWTIKKIKTL